MKKTEKIQFRSIQLGTSSLILIFTVLCMVLFSVLSIATAGADFRLAEKNKSHVEAYYDMDSKGEVIKAEVNEKLKRIYAESESNSEYFRNVEKEFGKSFSTDDKSINYVVPGVNEQSLLIKFGLYDYDENSSKDLFFKVMVWKIQNNEDYKIDDSMPVWEGK
ncbi:MAG: hypothetical protein ACI4LO_09905 [Anaerovoracaceae bacterium]